MSTAQGRQVTVDPALASAAVVAAGDAIVTTDSHGYITSWNRAAERLLGISAKQAIGQSLALIIPEAFRARHAACLRAGRSGGRAAPRRRQPRPVRDRVSCMRTVSYHHLRSRARSVPFVWSSA